MTYLQRQAEAVEQRIAILTPLLRERLHQWEDLGTRDRARIAWAIVSLLVWGHLKVWRLTVHAALHGGGAI